MMLFFIVFSFSPYFWGSAEVLTSFSLSFSYIILFFAAVVALVTLIVCFWSKSYLENLFSYQFWILATLSFVLSMFLFITSESNLVVVISFDLLGITSYILISYYKSKSVINSATITLMLSKLGDLSLMVSLLSELGGLCLGGALVLVAVLTKSALIPFSSWLPLAMAAPTPISALVHSSTLVTAGVLLSLKFSLETLSAPFLLLSFCSMFLASLLAVLETDYKKVVAMSTMSQMSMVGLFFSQGLFAFGMAHLITHAFFKSLMFISVGEILHSSGSAQQKSSLSHNKKNSLSLLFLSAAALSGQFYTSGFTSKDLILESFEAQGGFLEIFFSVLLLSLTFLYVGALLSPLSSTFSQKSTVSLFVLIYPTLTVMSGVIMEHKLFLGELFSLKSAGFLFPLMAVLFLSGSQIQWLFLWVVFLFNFSYNMLSNLIFTMNMDSLLKGGYLGLSLLLSMESLLTPLATLILVFLIMI